MFALVSACLTVIALYFMYKAGQYSAQVNVLRGLQEELKAVDPADPQFDGKMYMINRVHELMK